MRPDNAGSWALDCTAFDLYSAGMQARYDVTRDCPKQPGETVDMKGKVRRFYIAAVERVWDYAPSGRNLLNGKRLEEDK